MSALVDRLIDQLDTLVPFLALSREDAFRMLQEHRLTWFAPDEECLPEAYAAYRTQVNHSAFLLGYSYFESFLTDLLSAILRNRPTMLPKDRKVRWSEVIDSADKEELIGRLIRRELLDLLYKSMADIVTELRSRYGFTITEAEETGLRRASLIRNCILHNSSRADARLGDYDQYEEGQEFEVSAQHVHEYGLTLRALVRRMYGEAHKNHGIGGEPDA